MAAGDGRGDPDARRARGGAAHRRLGRADGRQSRPWPARRPRCSGERWPSLHRRPWVPGGDQTRSPASRWSASASALGADRVRVRYPGTWLRDDVYVTHGHYLDRHTTVPTLERLAIGAVARVAGEPAGGPAGAEDYETLLGPVYAWLDAYAGTGGRTGQGSSVSHVARALRCRATVPAASSADKRCERSCLRSSSGLNRAGLGPVSDRSRLDRGAAAQQLVGRDRRGSAATAGQRPVRDLWPYATAPGRCRPRRAGGNVADIHRRATHELRVLGRGSRRWPDLGSQQPIPTRFLRTPGRRRRPAAGQPARLSRRRGPCCRRPSTSRPCAA